MIGGPIENQATGNVEAGRGEMENLSFRRAGKYFYGKTAVLRLRRIETGIALKIVEFIQRTSIWLKLMRKQNLFVEVVRVSEEAQVKLFHVVLAGGACRALAGPVQRGQKQSRQNGDDRNYNKQFYQRKIFSITVQRLAEFSGWIE